MKKLFIISLLFAVTFAMPSFATPTEIDQKIVASKAYVDTKQDIIETGLVDYYSAADHETKQVASIVSYDSTNGLNGNRIGVLDYENIDNEGWNMLTGSEMDNFVPTVRAVAAGLQSIWDNMPSHWTALSWSNTQRTAINAYNSTFGNGTNNWAGTSTDLINGDFLARSLALKQNKIDAGTAGNVVTYTGTAGTVGSVAVSSTEDYNQQNELTNGSNLANVQLVSTKQNKMTCAGWPDGAEHTDANCWLWSVD